MTASFRSFCLGVMVVALSAAGRCIQITQCGRDVQAHAPPNEVSPKLSVVLSAVEDVVQAGSPLKVKIVITNTSDQPLWFWSGNTGDYGAVVCDEKGNAPPDTRFHQSMRHPDNLLLSGGYFDLPPGKSFTMVKDVGQLYDFGQPGRYAIYVRVSADYEDAAHRFRSNLERSNTISVGVTPAEGSPPSLLRN